VLGLPARRAVENNFDFKLGSFFHLSPADRYVRSDRPNDVVESKTKGNGHGLPSPFPTVVVPELMLSNPVVGFSIRRLKIPLQAAEQHVNCSLYPSTRSVRILAKTNAGAGARIILLDAEAGK
jgi:hypothetical protein